MCWNKSKSKKKVETVCHWPLAHSVVWLVRASIRHMLHPWALLCRVNRSPLPYHQPEPHHPLFYEQTIDFRFISHGAHRMASSSSTSTSSSNFQLIINNALDAYKKRTKNDLLAHPLAVKLQSCNTPSAILAVLQQQFQGLDQSQSNDDRWTRWLDPTVNVLFALSVTLGEGVGLVCLIT